MAREVLGRVPCLHAQRHVVSLWEAERVGMSCTTTCLRPTLRFGRKHGTLHKAQHSNGWAMFQHIGRRYSTAAFMSAICCGPEISRSIVSVPLYPSALSLEITSGKSTLP